MEALDYDIKNIYGKVILKAGEPLRGANLSGANLSEANLSEANLSEANLHDANLHDANLRGANLHDASLRYANLRGADLSGADLHDANLHDANLSGANLHDASLRYANLRGANTEGAWMPLYCRWPMSVIDGKEVQIGCERRTFEEWDKFFTSDQTLSTERGTEKFRRIEAYYKAVKAYTQHMNGEEKEG